ncbi:MAG TPA: endonuclease NucS domain-containing protein [Microbacteriaceae bacterium]|nr:endonuclease NucS domain-containing protein [Microbacteriaceae bacterium]
MVRYFRVSVGKNAQFLAEALAGGWIGTGWLPSHDLTGKFPDNWRDFNAKWVSVIADEDNTNRVAAGLAAGMTYTAGKTIASGDVVLVPTGQGSYRVGKVTGDYLYVKGAALPHRRPVSWLEREIARDELSDDLKRPLRSVGTVVTLGEVAELDEVLGGSNRPLVQVSDDSVENPLSFVLERHLEDFMVANWEHTELAKNYEIFTQDGEQIGQQYPTDTGPIDILATSKDGKEFLVIELKRGRVSDQVVGQILRYMGFINELDPSKTVRGIIIGTDDDQRFRRAISMVPNLEFYKYEVNFKLKKA